MTFGVKHAILAVTLSHRWFSHAKNAHNNSYLTGTQD